MDHFRADLHIHSRFSRATSKALNPRNLAAWANIKGIDVVGTGDFTHPEWLQELQDSLQEDSSGLLSIKNPSGLKEELPWLEGALPKRPVRFMLSAEISSIYKKNGKVRKIHNIVFLPNFACVQSFNKKLDQIGNLASDGRPILGLDSRDLLEMVLETDPLAFLVPAHIWTPWFSLFGSKSGFDAIEECFEDLSKEIFALETGLSSDPEMNWMWSRLDRFKLISNSDAHSGEKLGREANLFSGSPSYEGIYHALRGEGLSHKFLGTLEFYPEEGKYHLDGHRKCGVVLEPKETLSRGGLCPVCGKSLTIGVLNRVLALADREDGVKPPAQPGYDSLIPLTEILSEILGVGPKSKKVLSNYSKIISKYGSELTILKKVPHEDLSLWSPLLGEAIRRMRTGQVHKRPGFDGEYGVISVFSRQEQREFLKGKTFVPIPFSKIGPSLTGGKKTPLDTALLFNKEGVQTRVPALNAEQKTAVEAGPGPVLVLAGPGTGKTHTLIGRIRHLIDQGVKPRQILTLTFTRRAAAELKKRLLTLLGEEQGLPRADTLHALAFENWKKAHGESPVLIADTDALNVFIKANPGLDRTRAASLWQKLCHAREQGGEIPADLKEAASRYGDQKAQYNFVDYFDLLEFWLEQIKSRSFIRPHTHILVDEVQDLSPLQIQLINHLTPGDGHGFFGIGDIHQAIYSFRGGVVNAEQAFRSLWPNLRTIALASNYRSLQAVLDLAASLFPDSPPLRSQTQGLHDILYFKAGSGEQEANWIGDKIRALIGGTSHWQMDSAGTGELPPGEIAVLVRFKGLMPTVQKTLHRLGLPCSIPEKEAFWLEPRIELILHAVGSLLGLSGNNEEQQIQCPDKVLAEGPAGLAAYLKDIPPFDHMFWQSQPFLELKKKYKEHDGWVGLVNWINLQNELEQVRQKAEKVQIMTLHAAKGLEFEAVFLPALEEGIVPFAGKDFLSGKQNGPWDSMDVEEEKRLLYVGLTRAKSKLFLSCAAKRTIFGKTYKLSPSRFLQALPEEMLVTTTMKSKKVQREKQLTLLSYPSQKR